MISLCVPTRGRPKRFGQMVESARGSAVGEIEVCAWLDEDDAHTYPELEGVRYGSGPRPYIAGSLCTSGLWNRAWSLATGDIAMLAADDIVFRTPGWDAEVEARFDVISDHVLMVYCDDGTKRKAPVNPFVHRKWIETAGSFTPEDFQGWYADQWCWQLAAELGRIIFLKNVHIRHAQRPGTDQTYRDGEAARAAVGGWPGMRERFYSAEMVARRQDQLWRLLTLLDDRRVILPDPTPGWLQEALEHVGVPVE